MANHDVLEQASTFDFNTPFQVYVDIIDEHDVKRESNISNGLNGNQSQPQHTATIVEGNNRNQTMKSLVQSPKQNTENKNICESQDNCKKTLLTDLAKCIVSEYKNYHKNDGKLNREHRKRKLSNSASLEKSPEKKVTKSRINNEIPEEKRNDVKNLHATTQCNTNSVNIHKDNENKPEIDGTTRTNLNIYITNALNSLSDSLIEILKAHPVNIYDVTETMQYTKLKYHYFNLSYFTICTIILPRERYVKFTEYFLNNTLQMAQLRNVVQCSSKRLYPLFYEMIHWAKAQMHMRNRLQLVHKTNVTNTRSDNSILIEQLNKPTIALSHTNHINTIRVTPHAQPHREVIINYSPDILKQQDYCNKQLKSSMPITDALRNTEYIHNCNNLSDIHRSNYQPPHYDQRALWIPPETNDISENIRQHSNVSEYSSTVPNRLPPPYDPLVILGKEFMEEIPQSNTSLNASENLIENVRSSVSTDSGIMSPLPFSNTNDVTNTCQENTQVTPLITHVTSLNPKASYIPDGTCHICSRTTKQMCLGCYQIYYCSSQCQKSDWYSHQSLCQSLRHA